MEETQIRRRLRELCKPGLDRLAHLHGLASELGLQAEIQDLGGVRNLVVGDGPHWVSAHWDIVNPASENANDNSASCIACLELCARLPQLSCVIFDAEEVGGLGSMAWARSSPNVEWVINLELAGEGGASWLVGECNSKIGLLVSEASLAPRIMVPFNDSVRLRQAGLDACLVQPCPMVDGEPDISNWSRCHTVTDTVDALPAQDLDIFIDRFESLLRKLTQ